MAIDTSIRHPASLQNRLALEAHPRYGEAMSTHFVAIDSVYEGDLRCRAIHGPSHAEIVTDAPVDNQGKGESFSPTDLVATALGTCIATTMGIFAKRHDIDLRGMRVHVKKEMVQQPTRRIGCLATEVHVPLRADHPHRAALENAAVTCPVHRSLDHAVEIPITFHWAQ
jgi:putative redox protein